MDGCDAGGARTPKRRGVARHVGVVLEIEVIYKGDVCV